MRAGIASLKARLAREARENDQSGVKTVLSGRHDSAEFQKTVVSTPGQPATPQDKPSDPQESRKTIISQSGMNLHRKADQDHATIPEVDQEIPQEHQRTQISQAAKLRNDPQQSRKTILSSSDKIDLKAVQQPSGNGLDEPSVSEAFEKVSVRRSDPNEGRGRTPALSGMQVTPRGSVVFELFQRKAINRTIDLENPKNANSPGDKTRYTYTKHIAEGGMGRVDLVKDNDLNRYVAKKSILDVHMDDGGILERFVEEAQATGQLDHPNIVPVHDIGMDDEGQMYFTMKYIRGKTLEDVLDGLRAGDREYEEEYSSTRMLQIFNQICNAIAFAHSKGVIHRDLKPANIMLGSFGEVIVMDWGLAKVIASPTDTAMITLSNPKVATLRKQTGNETQIGSVVGTPAYMSPEQARGEIDKLDRRSDIYSLGAILYEILALAPPFSGGSVYTTISQVIQQEFETPEKKAARLKRKVHKELNAITLKAMAKEPDDRYDTAIAVAKDINNHLEGRAVTALPDSIGSKVLRWSRRNATTLRWTAAILVLLSGMAYGYDAYYRNTVTERLIAAGDELKDEAGDVLRKFKETNNRYNSFSESANQRIIRLNLKAAEQYRQALETSPSRDDIRDRLVRIYQELWNMAMREDNANLMAVSVDAVRLYLGDKYEGSRQQQLFDGRSTMTIASKPQAEAIYLFKYAESFDGLSVPVPFLRETEAIDQVWLDAFNLDQLDVEGPYKDAGFPLELGEQNNWGGGTLVLEEKLPGSYLAVLQGPDGRYQRVPFNLPRLSEKDIVVRLVGDSATPDGFTYVPLTEFTYGGDSAGAGQEETLKSGNFFITTQEASMGEYAEYLQALIADGKQEEAEARLPRDFGFTLLSIEEGIVVGTAQVPAEWRRTPARGVSYLDAKAFLEWKSGQDGRAYRLPTEQEWELAARGADGRRYSWGSKFDPKFVKLTLGYGEISAEEIAEMMLSSDTRDESPFGVRDMGGSMAEWVEGYFDPTIEGEDPEALRVIRGNAWGLTPIGLECAFRTNGPPNYFHSTIGFRYVFDGPSETQGS